MKKLKCFWMIIKKYLKFNHLNHFDSLLFSNYFHSKEFIEPAIENYRKNCGSNQVSNEDAYYLCIQLLDEVCFDYYSFNVYLDRNSIIFIGKTNVH